MPAQGSLFQVSTLLILAAFAGCTIPTFEHPLVSPIEAKACTELYGSYKSIKSPVDDMSSDLFSHVGYAGEGFPPGFVRIIDIEMFKDPAKAPRRTEIVCFLAQVEGHYVLHLPFKEVDKFENKNATNWSGPWDESKVKAYLLARLTKRDGCVELSFLSGEFAEEQIKAKKLSGQVREKTTKEGEVAAENEKTITVTAKSDELRTFFAKNIDGKLFHKATHRFAPIK